ncbi:MAG TPA: VOC family protein [Solirubrobacteraceae bacterium]|nr:VOC family protein [Solirubrobacteraceae bacterium]
MAHGTPTLATGKICHLEIPALDVERSSGFYRDAFGWELRTRGDGAIAFDDTVKEVSGSCVTGRPPSAEPGIMVHVMVADLDAALAAVRTVGGEVLNEDAAVDAASDRAVSAGAEVIYPLADQFYGERGGRVGDPFGNQWMLASRIKVVTPAELAAPEPA